MSSLRSAPIFALVLSLAACDNSVVQQKDGGGGGESQDGGAGGGLCAPPADHALDVVWSQILTSDAFTGQPGPGENPGDRSIDNVVLDASGNAFVSGTYWKAGAKFAGQTMPDGGQWNSFLAKLAPTGEPLWLKTFASAGYNELFTFIVTHDGGVAMTIFVQAPIDFGGGVLPNANGVFLVRYGAGGEYVFAKPSAGVVAEAPDGGFIMAGGIGGTIDLGGGPITAGQEAHPDAVLAKLDANGGFVFAHVFGDTGPNPLPSKADQTFGNVVVADDGRIFVTGTIAGDTVLDGIALKAPGMIFAAFDPSGHATHAVAFGDEMNGATVNALTLMPDGNLFLTGRLFGSIDFGGGPVTASVSQSSSTQGYLLALSPTAQHVWSHPFSAKDGAEVKAVSASKCSLRIAGFANGSVVVGPGSIAGEGSPSNGSSASGNGFEAILSEAGEILGSERFVGDPSSIAVRPDDSFVVAGRFHDSLSIGSLQAKGNGSPTSGFLVDVR
jgi:hypothetical protein